MPCPYLSSATNWKSDRIAAETPRPQSMTMEVIVSYVLIVVGWLGGAVNGAAVSTQEFTSAERCEAARLALAQDAKARGLEDALRAICLQK